MLPSPFQVRPHPPLQFYGSAWVISPFPCISGRLFQLASRPSPKLPSFSALSPPLSTFKDLAIPHLDQRGLSPALPVSGLLPPPSSAFSSLLPKFISKILLRLGNSASSPPPCCGRVWTTRLLRAGHPARGLEPPSAQLCACAAAPASSPSLKPLPWIAVAPRRLALYPISSPTDITASVIVSLALPRKMKKNHSTLFICIACVPSTWHAAPQLET